MRAAQYSNLKTVNIDSDIFNQTIEPVRSKLPLQFLKSIVQKKRSNQISSHSRGERFISSLSKMRQVAEKQQLKSQSSIKDIHKALITVELIPSKKNNKTNSQVENYRVLSFTDKNLTRLDQSFNKINSKQLFQNDREASQGAKSRFFKNTIKLSQENFQDHQFRQNIGKINPYTHQQYAYITYKERDHLQEVKKATRFQRISSIAKSYKVSTIQLAIPNHQRRPSVQYTPSSKLNIFSPFKRQAKSKKLQRKEPQIIPWQWRLDQFKETFQ